MVQTAGTDETQNRDRERRQQKKFFGTEITQLSDGDIAFLMKGYIMEVEHIPISRARRKQRENAATDEKRTALKSLPADSSS